MSTLELITEPSTPPPLELLETPSQKFAPVDVYGMPYPIHPYEPLNGHQPTWTDDHHSFYQRNAPELQGDDGRAVRYSRCLTVARWLHNNFHTAYPDGTESLPQTRQDKFAIAVLAAAGYMPREAVDVRDPKNPGLVEMSDKIYNYVQHYKNMHFELKTRKNEPKKNQGYAKKHIGKFFAQYAQEQDLTHLGREVIRDFLDTRKSVETRRRLGMMILHDAIELAAIPVDPIYMEALDLGLVKYKKPKVTDIVTYIFPEDRWPDYFRPMRRRLRKAA
ncbi:MAG: hypothetical protein M3Q14_02770 [bacterium]|nr:hypothetical protein [bacterium]